MATQPKPANHEPEHKPAKTEPAKTEPHHETPKPAPVEAPVLTVADEQRARSAEIEKVGTAKWVEDHDERTAEEKQPKAVVGVQQPSKADVEGHKR